MSADKTVEITHSAPTDIPGLIRVELTYRRRHHAPARFRLTVDVTVGETVSVACQVLSSEIALRMIEHNIPLSAAHGEAYTRLITEVEEVVRRYRGSALADPSLPPLGDVTAQDLIDEAANMYEVLF